MQAKSQKSATRILYSSSFISGTGNWLTSLVIFIWVFETTKSPFWMSLGILAHRLPMPFGAFFLSGRAENHPVRTHAFLDFVRAGLLLLMAACVWVQDKSSSSIAPVILFLALAGIRSFTSGSDGALKAKILAETLDQSAASHAQQVLQSILGATGILASVLFIAGILQVNFL